MTTALAQTKQVNSGLCPHGLPPAACPICSKMSGAGGSNKSMQKSVKPAQWSYMKCLAVGLAMKAQKARAENIKSNYERQIEFAQKLRNQLETFINRIKHNFELLQNKLPSILNLPLQIISKFILLPMLNLLVQIPKIIEKIAQFQKEISNFIQQTAEKLTAIYGEIKNFINKNIIENLKKKAKKFFLFFISDIEDKNFKNDDELTVFKSRELKKFLKRILKVNKEKDDFKY